MKSTFVAAFGASIYLLIFVALSATTACASGPGTVTNVNDAGPGSLRAAMASGATLIDFDPSFLGVPRTIKLESPLPDVYHDLSIIGPGPLLLTLDGQLKSHGAPLINIYDSSPTVRLEGFTLTRGFDAPATGHVGGIFSRGRLTLANVRVTSHRGAAIFNQGGVLSLEGSTVVGNSGQGLINQGGTAAIVQSVLVSNGEQGAFNQGGRLTVVNSTFTSNQIGVYNQVGDLSIYNSTIVGNREYGVAGGSGGQPRLLTVQSSILANNGVSELTYDSPVSINYSLIEFVETTINGVGNVLGVDPKLGVLSLNGGATLNFMPLPGSPAIDAGANPLNLAIDQRGGVRVASGRADIGSVETIPEPTAAVLLIFAASGFIVRRLPQATRP